jgi:hypothetical protein
VGRDPVADDRPADEAGERERRPDEAASQAGERVEGDERERDPVERRQRVAFRRSPARRRRGSGPT